MDSKILALAIPQKYPGKGIFYSKFKSDGKEEDVISPVK